MKALIALLFGTLALQANPDLFLERFADPETRPEAIAMLTPGTRDHFFHTALDHQLSGREKEYKAVMTAWQTAAEAKKDPFVASVSSKGIETLETRRILRDYDRDPEAALKELTIEWGMTFDDSRPDSAAEEKALPTALDPKIITAEAFRKEAGRKSRRSPYTYYSQEVLYADLNDLNTFSEDRIRWYIGNFQLTQHPNYVALLAKGIALKPPIALSKIALDPLSLAQMEALRKAVPAIAANERFNIAFLEKLRPSTPEDLERDPEAHAAFLAKCRDYVATLPPANNSLKSHILYHHLRLQEKLGNHPKKDLLAYLALPRRSHPIIRPTKQSDHFAHSTRLLDTITQCPSVSNDTELVESYLTHFLALADTPDKDLVPLIQEEKLTNLHARARILAGADPKLDAPRLTPEEYKQLREETRIEFAPTVPQLFSSADDVSLPLDLKNAPTLLIRIYELQPKSASAQTEASVDLDGLVPHHTRSLTFDQSPAILHRENIALPELEGAGSWIVEFVAERISARALVKKGNITPYVTRTANGQEIRLFDEKSRPVTEFAIELGTETFDSKNGTITVPNAPNQPRTSGTITAGKLTENISLGSRSDSIDLETEFLLDREQLLANQDTTLHLRNQLTNHGQPVSLDKVKNATLVLKAKLLGDVTTERVIADPLELKETNEIPFLVPENLLSLTITLSGTVTPETSPEPITLTRSETYELNRTLLTPRIGTAFFSPTAEGYRLELRGRNGEPLPNHPLTLTLFHKLYSTSIIIRLRSDDSGRIALGELDDIEKFTATSSSIPQTTFHPPIHEPEVPGSYIVPANQVLRIPSVPDPNNQLIRLPDKTPMPFKVTEDGYLSLSLDPGKYHLTQGVWKTDIEVFPADSLRGDLLVTANEILPLTNPAAPTITSAEAEGETLDIRITDASPQTRVTVIAKRYQIPGWNAGLAPFPFTPDSPPHVTRSIRSSSYLTDRRLSDEIRYILDRRAANVFPGSMLPRPGQLLYRWTPEDIDQDEMNGRSGSGGFGSVPMSSRGKVSKPKSRGKDGTATQNHPTTLDFLSFPAAIEFNLIPDENGNLQIPLAKLEGAQFVEIIVADLHASDGLVLPLPASETPLRDQRLARPLPANTHHIATRSAASLAPGAEVEIRNLLDADWRAFTTLEDAHQFLLGSNGSDILREFSFITKWPSLDEKEKLTLLADHHCHELHLFLSRKDTAFFEKHVKPFLSAKTEPQFIDDYLLARDLSKYLRPYAFSRLNAAEKALLAQALPAAKKNIARELDLRWQLEAPSPDAETVLFTKTLKGSDLSATDSLGLADIRSGSADPFAGPPSMDSGGGLNSSGVSNGVAYITEKMRRIIIPRIDFEDTTVEEAIDFLRLRTKELDTLELDPGKKGMNFVVRPGVANERIPELRLENVPVAVALKYICDITKTRYRQDDFAITLGPQTDTGEDLFTRTFRVPPDFAASLAQGSSDSGVDDPFADTDSTSGGALTARPPIIELLRNSGINFPDGSSAVLGSNGQLLVTGTPNELDKIESLISIFPAQNDDGSDPFSAGGLFPVTPATPADDEFGVLPALPDSAPLFFPDRTRLWLEANYYRNTGDTGEDLIPLNRFWLELASWDGNGPFTSPHFNACTTSANEALMCLALLDLPFSAEKPEIAIDGNTLKVKAVAHMLLFYKDTRETDKIAPESPLLVRQSYHPLSEPFRTVDGKRIENTHTGDFRTGTAYGVSLVITNPTGIERRIETLAQIPAGSIPLATDGSNMDFGDGRVLLPLDDEDNDAPATLSTAHDLEPYGVIRLQLAFYFPAAGDYSAYPLHVSENGTVLAHAQPRTLRVSAEPEPEDSASWEVIARDGTAEAVLNRLTTENLDTIDLDKILWRMSDKEFFLKATAILRERLHHHEDIAFYAILHNDPATLSDLLENIRSGVPLGRWFDSKLVTITPEIHHGWKTREFDPLVKARTHPFGDNPNLSHPEALQHYRRFLEILSWKPSLSSQDQLTLTLFLLLQERIGETLERFPKINPADLPDRLQYDYLRAITLFHQEKPAEAKAIALTYSEKLPPGLWKDRYDTVIAQADEIARPVPAIAEKEEEKTYPQLLITQNSEDSGKISLKHTNLTEAAIRLYHIDLEILFSKDPFLKGGVESSLPPIAPNRIAKVPLNQDGTTLYTLPEEFNKGNILVAAEAENVKRLKVIDSQAIEIRTNPTERTVQIIDPATGKPLPKTYVKVFAETSNGSTEFHKDGYTDLRGKFDYLSHTAKDPSNIRRLAILISHPEKGSRTTIINR